MSLHQDVGDAIAYLAEHAKSDFRNMPERTVANVLNKLSPEARHDVAAHFNGTQRLVESGGRLHPFEHKVDVESYTTKPMRDVYQKVEDEQTLVGLNDRMGTKEQNERIASEQPTSLRDIIDASFDANAGETP